MIVNAFTINNAHVSLKDKFVSGVFWGAGAQAIQQALNLGVTIILARQLLPADYGMIAMILVFTGFAQMFVGWGFSAAIIQRQDLGSQHTSSVFWISTAAALALTLAFYGAAPHIAGFYGMPALEPVARWLSLTFVFSAFSIVPEALLRKSMAFERLAKIEVLTLLVPGGVAIYLALNGWGVWSLVVQYLAHQAMRSALMWFYSAWRLRLRCSLSAVRELFGYGANLTGFNFITYWGLRSDALLIGKFMDSASLGIYSRAHSLMLIPVIGGTQVISKVMFPILSSIQDDKKRVKRAYLRATRLMAFTTFPMMLGLFVVAEPFVLAALGPNWTAVAPIVQIFCFVGVTQTLCYPAGTIYMSQGRTDLIFRWGIGNAATLIVAVIIGVSFDTVAAVALAYLIASLALTYPCLTIPGKLIGMTFSDVIGHVAGIFGCAAAMAAGVWSLGLGLPSDWPAWAILVVQVPVGVVMYVAIAWLVNLDAFMEFKDVVLQLKYKRKIASTYV